MKKGNYDFPPIPPIPRIPWNRPGRKASLDFKRLKQRAALKKLFKPPADKSFQHLWNKNVLMEIFRIKKKFVLQEFSSCVSRNCAVYINVFSDANQTWLLENL